MLIYFIRHQETEWNAKGIIQGHKDSPLTAAGKEIAQSIAEKFKGAGIEIIYTSDLGRCVETANIISKSINCRIITGPYLREQNYGAFNGEAFSKASAVLDLSNPDEIPLNGESFNQMKSRIVGFISRLASNKKFNTALVVLHEGGARAIFSDYYNINHCDKRCDTSQEAIYALRVNNKGSIDRIEQVA